MLSLMFLLPVVVFTQQPWHKYSPTNYMWMNVGDAGFSAGEADYTSLAFSPIDGQPYVAYSDWANSGKVTVMKFNGQNWVIVGNAGFSLGEAEYTSLAFNPTNGQPYVAYQDYSNYSGASVMTLNNNNWIYVGVPNFSQGQASYISLAVAYNGQLFCGFEDMSGKATVMKFNFTTNNYWEYEGNAGFSSGEVAFTSFVINSIGAPYLAFQDFANNGNETVMTLYSIYDNWANAGNAGFSAGEANYSSLAINPVDNLPAVAYEDYGNSRKATVMKFDGTSWLNVGNAGFSIVPVAYTSLAFNQSGEPFLAYMDSVNGKATVMKFDGSNWVNVGNADFSSELGGGVCLSLSPSGQPYVAYIDYGDSNKVTVMKYDSIYTGINEQQEAMLSVYPNPARDKITVEISKASIGNSLAIVNVEGQQLLTQQITENKTQIDISCLPSGVYFVQLINDNMIGIEKIIKQ